MEKITFIADLHLKNWNDNEFTSDGISLKLQEILNVFKDVCDYSIKHNIKHVIIGGDINDTKSVVNARSFVLFQRILMDYTDLEFFIIPGNHDTTGRDSDDWGVQLFSGISNVHVFTKPTILFDDILMMPWSSKGMLDNIKKYKKQKVFIGHLGLNEANLSSGISLRNNISAKDFKKFDLVLLGHYHKPQSLRNDSIFYVGSPIPMRRDEANEEKRFLVIDENLNVGSILTKGYRRYIEFNIDENSSYDDIAEEISNLKEEGHHIILRNSLKNLPPVLRDVENIQIIDQYEEEFEIRGITSSMKLKDQMIKYMEIEGVPEDKQNIFLNIGLKALQSVGG